MFCQSCGAKLNDGEEYCYQCGKKQAHAEEFVKSGEKKPIFTKTKFMQNVQKTSPVCRYTRIPPYRAKKTNIYLGK